MVSPTSLYQNEQKMPGCKVYFELEQNEHVWLERMPKHTKAKLWEAREGHKTIYGGYQVDENEKVF
jgi:hypothetical protein